MPPTNADPSASFQGILNDVWDEAGHFLRLSPSGVTGIATKSVVFDGSAGNGAVGTVALLTVTGQVLLALIGVCTVSLAGATATIKVGIAGSTARYIPQITATNIVAGSTIDLTGLVSAGTAPGVTPNQVGFTAESIIATIATAGISAGALKFYAFYRALTSDGKIA